MNTHLDFFDQIEKKKNQARCASPCSVFIGAGGCFFPWISRSVRLHFFVVSLFHGLLMGSRPSFRIQRHAAFLMIIRSTSNRFTTDSPATVWPVHSHEAKSICWSLGGRKVQVYTTSHQCRFNQVLSHWEERDFGVLLTLPHPQGHGSESIDHNGSSDHH